jgi:hypothetical protein
MDLVDMNYLFLAKSIEAVKSCRGFRDRTEGMLSIRVYPPSRLYGIVTSDILGDAWYIK